MRFAGLHKPFNTFLVSLYLLLGVMAAWHAPHFSQARQAIDVDRHAHHEVAFEGDCALCTVKTAPQVGAVPFVYGLVATTARAPEGMRAPSAAVTCVFAGRPRAPPLSLS